MAETKRSSWYSADFEEGLFPVAQPYKTSYECRVTRGYETMRQRRIVMAGLARNLEHVLPWTIARIERLGRLFRDYRVVVYENDSVDNTKGMLAAWASRDERVTAVLETHDDPVHRAARCLSRAARMAHYRRQCQQTIIERFGEFDEVILIDMDLHGGWSYDGIGNTFGHANWDFVGANGVIYRREGFQPNKLLQYDAWAYRTDAAFSALTTRQVNGIVFQRGEPMLPVFSCFGGLGIYRMSAYKSGVYTGDDVEHVTFHRSLVQQGFNRLFLNPSQVVLYGRKHRSWDRLFAGLMKVEQWIPGRTPVEWQFPKQRPPYEGKATTGGYSRSRAA